LWVNFPNSLLEIGSKDGKKKNLRKAVNKALKQGQKTLRDFCRLAWRYMP